VDRQEEGTGREQRRTPRLNPKSWHMLLQSRFVGWAEPTNFAAKRHAAADRGKVCGFTHSLQNTVTMANIVYSGLTGVGVLLEEVITHYAATERMGDARGLCDTVPVLVVPRFSDGSTFYGS